MASYYSITVKQQLTYKKMLFLAFLISPAFHDQILPFVAFLFIAEPQISPLALESFYVDLLTSNL